MEGLVLVFMMVGVIVISMAVTYHAAHADELLSFGKRGGRGTSPPEPDVVTAEWGEYVRRGLEDLAVMLAQAARKRPS